MPSSTEPPVPPRRPVESGGETRPEREAAALRRNLLRRKQQSRERDAAKPEPAKR